MKSFWQALAFFAFVSTAAYGDLASVDIVRYSEAQAKWQTSPGDLMEAVCTASGFSGYEVPQSNVIAWSVKKEDSNRPPSVLEEAIVLLNLADQSTNLWLLAYMRRNLARDALTNDKWIPGPSGTEMSWECIFAEKPGKLQVIKFLAQSNFGNNECMPSWIPLQITLYAPFDYLRKLASKGISRSERARRWQSLNEMIWDPRPKR